MSDKLVPWRLLPQSATPQVHSGAEGIEFEPVGWFEVLLRVDWDPTDQTGTRVAHTRIPDQEPLHSEAIDASGSRESAADANCCVQRSVRPRPHDGAGAGMTPTNLCWSVSTNGSVLH
jgi:hypothetical protein